MKKLIFFLLIVAFVLASTSLYAAQKAPLGFGNIAVKLDYISFTEDEIEELDVETGLYVGLEGYANITPNLLIGIEAGYVKDDGGENVFDEDLGISVKLDTKLTYVPIELNLKYAFEPADNLVMDFGIGGSYNYYNIDAKASVSGSAFEGSDDDWLWGGQIFADLNYKIGQFFLGINGKYQITEDVQDGDVNFSNWRVGGQIGIMF